ncbi:carbon starvation CstA family protein [Shigella flexneri]
MKLDLDLLTPAVINNDGLNHAPINGCFLVGYHFAGHCRRRLLVGRTRRADGYLPGTLRPPAGVVLAGAVQDFMVRRSPRAVTVHLWVRLLRRDGTVPGTIALFGCFRI